MPISSPFPPRRLVLTGLAAALTAATAVVGPITPARAATTTYLYVSPTGSGTACSASRPCSLDQAKATVRTLNRRMTRDIVVQLADGVYRRTTPLTFTAADSGNNGHTVSWQAAPLARPVISGAGRVTGWTLADSGKNIYQARVGTGFDTRQLYVDGIAATRARTEVKRSDFTFTTAGMTITNSALAYLRNVADQSRIELEAIGTFTDRYSPVQSISGNTITMQQPAWENNTFGYDTIPRPFRNGPMYLANAYEFLDSAGEWYLNTTTGTLYYKPLPGQSMNSVDVELPLLPSLVHVGGTYAAPAHHISFSGITFTGTSWLPDPGEGFADQQTGAFIHGKWARPGDWLTSCQVGCKEFEATRPYWHQMPAAVQVSAANNVSFTRDRFVNLGQTALGIGNDANAHATGVGLGASSITVTGSVFTASSAGAIVAGGVQADAHHPRDSRMINKNITISNNLVHDIGLDYRGIVSFLPTYVTNVTISHNEIHDMPYTGVAFGYGWGANDAGGSPDYQKRGLYDYQPVYQTPTTAANNKIVNNYIHDTMQQMSDGSCIYSLSANPDGRIDGNYCLNTNGHFGLYFDEGSRHITTSDNVFEATTRWAHANYQGGNNTGALTLTNNWTTNADTNAYNGDHGNTVGGNTTVTTGSWPSGAAATIATAGIEPAYQDIKAGPVASPYRTYSSTPATFGQAGGQFTISAAGAGTRGLGGRRDDEYGSIYAAQAAVAGTSVTTRVDALSNTGPQAKAGVVLRNNLTGTGDSRGYAIMTLTPGRRVSFQWDANGDGHLDSRSTTAVGAASGVWVRLTRSDSKVSAFYSTDGNTFTQVGTAVTLPGIATTQDAGLIYTAHSTEVGRALFTNLRVTTSPYTAYSSVPAAIVQSGGLLSVTAAGSDVWAAGGQHADEYGALYRPAAAGPNATVTVRVDSAANTNGWAKAGIMLRADIAGSPTSTGYAVLAVTPSNGVVLQWDSDGDGLLDQAANNGSRVTAPVWLRLTRNGNTITGQYSTDGSTFTTAGSATLSRPTATEDAGVFFTSHAAGVPGTATFNQFTIAG